MKEKQDCCRIIFFSLCLSLYFLCVTREIKKRWEEKNSRVFSQQHWSSECMRRRRRHNKKWSTLLLSLRRKQKQESGHFVLVVVRRKRKEKKNTAWKKGLFPTGLSVGEKTLNGRPAVQSRNIIISSRIVSTFSCLTINYGLTVHSWFPANFFSQTHD